MSLSGALNNALSGLVANGRITEVISQNVANSLTEGYARREVELQAQALSGAGTGVRIAGVDRQVDPVLLADRRRADASLSRSQLTANLLASIEGSIGLPGEAGALTERLAAFDAALISASSRPDLGSRLQDAVTAAKAVALSLNQISDAVQEERLRADSGIANAVERLNQALEQVADLNGQISRLSPQDSGASGLLDQRQSLIDEISEFIPLREVQRDNGTVALYSVGGATLLDFRPAEFGFTPTNLMTPQLDVSLGSLSGLIINGSPVVVDPESGPVSGGSLSTLFNIRDTTAPEIQNRMDAIARDLVERFQDPAVDPTLLVGDAGLFTDSGVAFDVSNEIGLSSRIAVNAAVDPTAGGASWRLRDGINAVVQGPVGDASLINTLHEAFNAQRLPASGGFAVARSATGLATDMLSSVSLARNTADAEVAFNSANQEGLRAAELRNGVDTDAEMQKLLLVEQAYAANARVISTIDELLQSILAI